MSEEDRKALQTMPQLTMVTASTATVFRDIDHADTVRHNRQRASDGWAYVLEHFHEIPLKHEEIAQALMEPYGLGSTLSHSQRMEILGG